MNVNDGPSCVLVRQREVKLSVEPTWSSQRRVDVVGTICGTNNNDLTTAVHAIHQGKQSRNNAGMDLLLLARPNRGQAINLVKEDDAWLCSPSLLKQQPKLLLGLANPLAQCIGAFAHVKADLATTTAD